MSACGLGWCAPNFAVRGANSGRAQRTVRRPTGAERGPMAQYTVPTDQPHPWGDGWGAREGLGSENAVWVRHVRRTVPNIRARGWSRSVTDVPVVGFWTSKACLSCNIPEYNPRNAQTSSAQPGNHSKRAHKNSAARMRTDTRSTNHVAMSCVTHVDVVYRVIAADLRPFARMMRLSITR